MDLNVFKIIEKTTAEGPGVRFCIWVQGCSRRCNGCYAKNTWDKNKGTKISTDELFSLIKMQKEIEGVTFLGGEPFEQAEGLSELAEKIKDFGLSIVTFTGNTYEDLKAKNDKFINKLLKSTDLLIDGEFQEENLSYARAWVGSTNQRYIFLTERYSDDDIKNAKNKVEIRISKNGKIFMNGMGNFDKLLCDLMLLKK